MVQRIAMALVGAAGVMVGAGGARAAPNACVPEAVGVPTREGPPKWSSYFTDGDARPAYFGRDEPRWLGATLESFQRGSAKSAAEVKALWSHEGANDYLYLSFAVNVNPNPTMRRDVFIGFRRPTPLANERAYVLQFELRGGAFPAPTIAPQFCSDSTQCGPANWRVWVDRGNKTSWECDLDVLGDFPEYDPMNGGDGFTPPFTWLNGSRGGADVNEDILFWVNGDQWNVYARLKLATATGRPLSEGLDPASKVWYEISESLAAEHLEPGDQPTFAPVAAWPRGSTAVCVYDNGADYLIHRDLGDEANWGLMSRLGGTNPPPVEPCDAGLEIGAVGSMPDPTINLFAGVTPGWEFKGYAADGVTPARNVLIAIARNTSNAPITGVPLRARFRLAGWGSAPWSDETDTGVWTPIPGTENGVCAVPPITTGPNPDPVGTVCHGIDFAPAGTAFNQDRWAVTHDWYVGDAAGGGPSEFCKYGLTPAANSCEACACTDAGAQCDRATDTGTRAHTGALSGPGICVSKKYQYDQCMLVELDAPAGNVRFTRHSTWNNMTFGQMSVDTREALIDTRALPAPEGDDQQDIYLLVMPRNMPRVVPPGTTGMRFIRRAAIARAAELVAPYAEDIRGMTATEVYAIAGSLGHYEWGGQTYGGTQYGGYGEWPIALGYDPEMADQAREIAWARAIMPSPGYEQIGNLLDVAAAIPEGEQPAARLTKDAVTAVGGSTAAELVPTLEVYPFYRVSGPNARRKEYAPMTSFTVFLSHEGPFDSIGYEIDGAEKVAENVYHLGIPVGRARRLQFRSQAVQPGDAVQPGGDPDWPCDPPYLGCCDDKDCGTLAGVNRTLPLTVACAFAFGRKRRKQGGRAKRE